MEDREKIQTKIRELNSDRATGPWDEAEGFQMMPTVKLDKSTNQYNIYMDSGISVKVFINQETGETKIYWADAFMKESVS